MSRPCTICLHPDRDLINRGLIDREPLHSLAVQYGTSVASLFRHKASDIPAALMKAEEALEVAGADALISQLKDLRAKAETVWASAEQAGDRKSMLGSIREARSTLELLWKVTEPAARLESGSESHPVLREPLEVRRWFLLSGRMPSSEEREMLSAMRAGEEITPEQLKRALGVKAKT